MIYGIDFDGTIVTEKFPEIGEPIEKVVDFIRDLQAKGHKWVLITMREGKYLDDAVEWLKAHGLTPDAVNDNLPERVAMWGNNPRKIYADIYIDDHNAGGVQLPIILNWNVSKTVEPPTIKIKWIVCTGCSDKCAMPWAAGVILPKGCLHDENIKGKAVWRETNHEVKYEQ